MRGLFALLGCGVLAAGCQCQPQLPSDPTRDTDTEPTGSTATTADTAPPPPCAVPEIEPNNSEGEATVLPLERRACGFVNEPFDMDWFSFDVDDPGWLLIEVQAKDGSIADMTFLLTADEWAATKDDDTESTDASLVFPAPAGPYLLGVSEEQFGGGDRYDYEVLVSEAKAPVVCERDEVEVNDDAASAEVVTSGECLFGNMFKDGPIEDFDWYRITIPPGKHTLTLDIDAFDFGSSADLTILLYDDQLETLGEFRGGQISGVQLDPYAEYDSAGDEVVWISVFDSRGEESLAGWYAMHVTLEAG